MWVGEGAADSDFFPSPEEAPKYASNSESISKAISICGIAT